MCNLVLLAGIPGTGKSTWAKTFFDLKYAVVSSDQIRKGLAGSLKEAHERAIKPWDLFYKRIENHLVHSVDVIADATFLTIRHRERAREVATKTGAKLHLVLFTDWYSAHDRNAERDGDARVPNDVMADMMNLYWETFSRLHFGVEEYDSLTHVGAFNVA